MDCNIFISCFNSYSITKDGKVYSKYENKYLDIKSKNGFNEVLFSFGTGKERFTQWFRIDWLVALRYIPNPNGYNFINHRNGINTDDNYLNLEWRQYCTDEPCEEIQGYRGKYIITNSGKVYNNFLGIEMKPRLIAGYPHVGLRVFDGEKSTQKLFKVHRLVAEYFIPNPNNYPVVNHIDGDKQNSHYTNLEWCSYKQNSVHAVKTGLVKTTWTRELGRVAITLIEDYNYSSSEVAKLLGKTKSTVMYLYQRGYKNLGLTVNNSFVRKTSKHIKSKKLPEYYKNYITQLLKDNTVLNTESKGSVQCND